MHLFVARHTVVRRGMFARITASRIKGASITAHRCRRFVRREFGALPMILATLVRQIGGAPIASCGRMKRTDARRWDSLRKRPSPHLFEAYGMARGPESSLADLPSYLLAVCV